MGKNVFRGSWWNSKRWEESDIMEPMYFGESPDYISFVR